MADQHRTHSSEPCDGEEAYVRRQIERWRASGQALLPTLTVSPVSYGRLLAEGAAEAIIIDGVVILCAPSVGPAPIPPTHPLSSAPAVAAAPGTTEGRADGMAAWEEIEETPVTEESEA